MMLTLASLLPSSDHGLNCEEACCSEKEKREMRFFSFPFLGPKKIKRTVSRPEHSWSEVKVAQSCPTLCNPMEYSPWNFPGQNTGVGSLSLLQWIFPTQESNQGLPHCRQVLFQLSYQTRSLHLLKTEQTLTTRWQLWTHFKMLIMDIKCFQLKWTVKTSALSLLV